MEHPSGYEPGLESKHVMRNPGCAQEWVVFTFACVGKWNVTPVYHVVTPRQFISPPLPYMVILRDFLQERYGFSANPINFSQKMTMYSNGANVREGWGVNLHFTPALNQAVVTCLIPLRLD